MQIPHRRPQSTTQILIARWPCEIGEIRAP